MGCEIGLLLAAAACRFRKPVGETDKVLHSAISQNQYQNQNQRPFTTEGTEENQGLPLTNTDDTDLKTAGERMLPKAELGKSWGELPIAAIQTDAISGSFGAPSTSLGISPAGSTPAERLNFGAPSSRGGTRACSG
jgi:hypothetical protein